MAPNIVRAYGDRALLLEYDSIDAVLASNATLRAAALPGVVDIVPGSLTILIEFGSTEHVATGRRIVSEIPAPTVDTSRAPQSVGVDIVVDVVYNGSDLADVAELTGLGVADIIEAHTQTPWRVGFGGFAPGFAYLIGGDPRLHVPRRKEPRTRVPAGSVALAGEFSGIYPRDSPGGWQLIGHSDAPLWDIDRQQPALLMPGMWVQFRAQA